VDRATLQSGALVLDPAQHQVTLNGQPVNLTTTEFDLLYSFMRQPGYAFTRAELMEQTFGYSYESMERTLDSHIKNLRKKIEPDARRPIYIQTVHGVGYRFRGESA
jgi:two-component system alkaline phosphatase synthesis response regulator PhoP